MQLNLFKEEISILTATILFNTIMDQVDKVDHRQILFDELLHHHLLSLCFSRDERTFKLFSDSIRNARTNRDVEF